jgi:SAM-dependent methyltransferase
MAPGNKEPDAGGAGPRFYGADADLAYFKGLWEKRSESPVQHSPEVWDSRAGEWINRLGERGSGAHMRGRASAAAAFLKDRGLLGGSDSVIDVGCGPGLFVTEFAHTAKHATGLDFSARFIDYARKYAAVLGVKNVDFRQCDFNGLNIEEAGLVGAYDLVFTSITPAASGKGCLDKLMRMSRRWCYNASFVHAEDDLAERVSRDVFGHELVPRWDGRGFYALANLLWLSGYYPETSYYDETRDETAAPTLSEAAGLASRCGYENGEGAQRVLRYLEAAGEVRRRSRFRYGVILWDVTRCDRR